MSKHTSEKAAAALHNLVRTAEGNFAQAFIEETGLLPSQAVMNYGPIVNAHGKTEFRIWFTRKEEAEELLMLRSVQVALLAGDTVLAIERAKMASLSFPQATAFVQ
jgi:hypothetical protein